MINVMIDTETMGTGDFAPILSLGAVVFDIDGPIKDKHTGINFNFYSTIDLRSTVAMGAKIEVDTVLWWLTQPDEARKALIDVTRPHVKDVLEKFQQWWPTGNVQVWANSPTFDCKKLDFHLKRCKINPLWEFRQERDFRTIQASLPNVEWRNSGAKKALHNALADAKAQAAYLLDVAKANNMTHML